jgi:hypothetical protein
MQRTSGRFGALHHQHLEAVRQVRSTTWLESVSSCPPVPGFIDGHVHFNSAGALVLDVNLMTVADDEPG